MNNRDQALRALLVEQVAQQGRRSRWRTIAATAVIAFVVGGGAVGGALSAAAAIEPRQASPTSSSPGNNFDDVLDGGKAVGPMRALAGPGDADFTLGPRPAGATAIAVALRCNGFGRYALSFGGESRPGTCSAGTWTAFSSESAPAGSRVQLKQDSDRFAYTLWAEWISVPPPPQPSAAQLAEVADGVITEQEAKDAASRYLACMYGAGFPEKLASLAELSFTGGITATQKSDDFNASMRCQTAELSRVSPLWSKQQGNR